jgi:cytochrome c5
MKLQWLLAGVCALVCACGSDAKKADDLEVENTCAASVSYETVGEPFLEAHCQRCHGSAVGRALGGGHVFASEAQLAEHGHDAYEHVEAGTMPKDGAKVPEAEKRAFLDWLECSGLAEGDGSHAHD